MTITYISEKAAEERKREKRLVHLTNTLCREFIESAKPKSKDAKNLTEYLIKSFLDYVFFYRHKEIGELNEEHIRHFLLEYAIHKMALTKESGKTIPDLMSKFIDYLDTNGYIKNGINLKKVLNENSKEFSKLLPAKKPTTEHVKESANISATKNEIKIGRNDPCPCGSGKKYKKCCGRTK